MGWEGPDKRGRRLHLGDSEQRCPLDTLLEVFVEQVMEKERVTKRMASAKVLRLQWAAR